MKKYLILLLFIAQNCFAQDPGIRDTVNFGTCQSYIVADGNSLYGKVKVPCRVFNDEAVASILICYEWNGPVKSDTLVFYGKRADSSDFIDFILNDSIRHYFVVQALVI